MTQFNLLPLEKCGDIIISVDFGHKNDIAIETVFRKDKSGLTILSQKVIGRADDFNTEEKRNKYLNNE
jgi:hypothetical protein|nr:MAG TPA: hypothetical protein [Caudoviricetes sp.]